MALEKNIEQITRSTIPSDDDLIYVAQDGLDRVMTRSDFLAGLGNGGTTGPVAVDDVEGLPEALNGKAPVDHEHSDATTTVSGFMSFADKTKLDGIEDGATAGGTGGATGPIEIDDVNGLDVELAGKSNVGHGHAIADIQDLNTTLQDKANIGHAHFITDVSGLETELNDLQSGLAGKAASDHVHDDATPTTGGFMSAADKAKLDTVQEGATAGGESGGGTFATEAQAREGTDATSYMNPIRTRQAIDEFAISNEVSGSDTQVLGFDASGNAVPVNNMRSMMVAVVAEDQALATGDGKRTFRQAIGLDLRELELFTPTGGTTATTVDVVVNGTSILSDPLSIAANASVATVTSFASASIPKGATVRVDVDAAGTGAKGLWVNFTGIAS